MTWIGPQQPLREQHRRPATRSAARPRRWSPRRRSALRSSRRTSSVDTPMRIEPNCLSSASSGWRTSIGLVGVENRLQLRSKRPGLHDPARSPAAPSIGAPSRVGNACAIATPSGSHDRRVGDVLGIADARVENRRGCRRRSAGPRRRRSGARGPPRSVRWNSARDSSSARDAVSSSRNADSVLRW